jgi:tripartite-type tricarboxylate transporter receptor subunit TctC
MKLKTSLRLLALITLGAGCIAAAGSATADEAAFFNGKTIAMIIAYPPGGGYDTYGRLYAKHVERHLPGAPKVIVRNMPGASGIIAANFLYNKAPKDGTSLAMFSSSAAFQPLLGNKRARFKTENFTWIGVIDQTTSTCAAWHTSGLKTFEDLKVRPSVFGAAAATALNSTHPRAFNALFGTRIKVIHGYPGGTSILLAMQRGEVDAICSLSLSSLLSVRREDYEAGRLIPIVQTGLRKHPLIKNVPHIYDYAKTKEDRQIFGLLFGRHVIGRPVIAPPDLPAERTATLRVAFDKTVADPAFIADSKNQHVLLDPLSGKETDAIVREILSTPPEIIAKTLKMTEAGNIVKVKLKVLEGTIANKTKRRIEVKGGDGKSVKLRLSGRQTKVTIAGKKAKSKAVKAGMSCRVEHLGEGNYAVKLDCKK